MRTSSALVGYTFRTMNSPPDQQRHGAPRRFVWVAMIGLLIGVAFLWLAFRKLEFSDLLLAFSSAKPWPWILFAMLFYLAGQVVRGLRCRWLVSNDTDLPLSTATNIVVLGYAVNNVLPARMGEVARAALLGERSGMPFTQSLTVTLLERILDGWSMLLLFWVGLALMPIGGAMLQTALVAAAIFGVASLGILTMLVAPDSIAKHLSQIVGRIRPKWQERIRRFVLSISNGLSYLRRPGQAIRVGSLSVLVWVLETGMFMMVLPAFGLPARFDWAVLAMAVTNLGIMIPSTPGYIGPFHFFCMQSLMLFGVAGATATSYAIAVHVVFFVPVTLWGVAVVLRYGIEIGWIASVVRNAGRDPVVTRINDVPVVVLGARTRSPVDERPSQLIVSLVDALVSGQVAGEPKPSEETIRETATFVQGQVNALPTKLRIAFSVGMFGFRILVRARYLRSFCALALSTRRRIVDFWAFGPYRFTRQLFRLLRSTAFLHYYEDLRASDGSESSEIVKAGL